MSEPGLEKSGWKEFAVENEFFMKKSGCVIMISRLAVRLVQQESDVERAATIQALLDEISHNILISTNRLEIRQIILQEAENWERPNKPVVDSRSSVINWKNAFKAIRSIGEEMRPYHLAVGSALYIVYREFWPE